MTKNKLSKDVAMSELDKFLFEVKKVNKESLLSGEYGEYAKQYYFDLINDVARGYFYFKDDKIIQILDFTCGKDVKELAYNPRLRARDLTQLAAYQQNDVEGRKCQVIAALTEQAIGIIRDLDTLDFERSKRVTEFYFLA